MNLALVGPPAPTPVHGSTLSGTLGAVLVAVLAALAVAGLAWMLVTWWRRDRGASVSSAIQPYQFVPEPPRGGGRVAVPALVESPLLQRAVAQMGRLAERRGLLQRVEAHLEQADSSLKAAEALFVQAAALVLGVALGFLLGRWVGGLVALAVFGLGPWVALDVRAKRRSAAFVAQVPDMLQLLATTLRSGFSLMQGLDTVARQLPDPLGESMRRAVAETRLGRPVGETLADLAAKVGNRDFDWVVTAITIQREVGGNLAELLDIVSQTMTARSNLRREIRTLTAEGRLSAIIIAILPAAIGLFVYAVNPGYITPLFHSALGKLFFFGAVALAVVGIFWMQRIVDIEV